jgi:DNA-directed RNA polymerase specialized sigma24 family protein
MLVDQKETREVVRQIVFKLTPHRGLHDDLAQEAIIHLWLRESQCPGQTESWYLQSCRFHLQNLLRLGRSVDATKHHGSLRPLSDAFEQPGNSADESAGGSSVPALVSAREALALLSRWLTPTEKRVLDFLMEGFSVRDVAARLGMSHTSVIRHRRQIARLAVKFGIEPVPSTPPSARLTTEVAAESPAGLRIPLPPAEAEPSAQTSFNLKRTGLRRCARRFRSPAAGPSIPMAGWCRERTANCTARRMSAARPAGARCSK